ncbi:hypothetical protein YBT020_06315 [Bacillus thuringiensis serovar finitimus YBT-020]|nr:hypothetical protein YBT020_06315 [Bacillus thuringiensis serovar finitimus YBT-020]
MIKYCKKAESVSHFLFIDAKIIDAAANINGKKETVEYGK